MKKVIFALFILTAPSFSFAASAFEESTKGAIEAFRSDYQADRGQNAPEPLGLRLEREEEEIISRVYFLDGNSLNAMDYGCHMHGNEYDCHRENRAELGSYTRSTSLYSGADLLASVPLALAFFEEKVAPSNTIQSLKLWEAEENIRYIVGYQKDGLSQVFYLACHFHGGHLDCHRKRDAGPGEPDRN